MAFNAAKSLTNYSGSILAAPVDFTWVVEHELGHALGLDHETSATSNNTVNLTKPTIYDIQAVRFLNSHPTFPIVFPDNIVVVEFELIEIPITNDGPANVMRISITMVRKKAILSKK